MKQIIRTIVPLLAFFISISVGHSQNWQLGGNGDGPPNASGLSTNSNFFGATQTASVRLGTGNISRIFVGGTSYANPGFIGIGSNFLTPSNLLHLNAFGNANVNGNLFRTDGGISSTTENQWRMYTGATAGTVTEKFSLFTYRSGLYSNLPNSELDFGLRASARHMFFQTATVAGTYATRIWINGGRPNQVINGFSVNTTGFVGIGDHLDPNSTLNPNGQYYTGPEALLHLAGPNNTGFTAAAGWRPWFRTGTYCQENSDGMYVGLKQIASAANRSDAVIAWSDDPAGGGPDQLKFIFVSPTPPFGTGLASSLDGMEMARFSPNGFHGFGNYNALGGNFSPVRAVEILDADPNTGSNIGQPQLRLTYTYDANPLLGVFTEFQTTNLGDQVINPHNETQTNTATRIAKERYTGFHKSNPGNTVEINSQLSGTGVTDAGVSGSWAGSTGASGLRFTDLRPSDAVVPVGTGGIDPTKVLSVDQNGDVVLINAAGATATNNGITTLPVANGSPAIQLGVACSLAFNNALLTQASLGTNRVVFLNNHDLLLFEQAGNTGHVGIGNIASPCNTVGNTLELGADAGSAYGNTNSSGLRFTRLTSASPVLAPGTNGVVNTKVLTVDANGDVVLVGTSGGGTSVGGYCGHTGFGLTDNFGIPLNQYTYSFLGQGGRGHVQFGDVVCNQNNVPARVYINNISGGPSPIAFKIDNASTTAPAAYFNGPFIVVNTTNYPSDSTLKLNETTISNAIVSIKELKPIGYFFDTLNPYGLNFSSKKQYGFNANEVKNIFPELTQQFHQDVMYDSLGQPLNQAGDFESVNYNGFIGILTAGIQEQQLSIDSLRNAPPGSVQAANGLSVSSGKVELGGTLTHNTTIQQSGRNMSFSLQGGNFDFGGGNSNTVTGAEFVYRGQYNTLSGNTGFVMGNFNSVAGSGHFVSGSGNTISGNSTSEIIMIGGSNSMSGSGSGVCLIGAGNVAQNISSSSNTALGSSNTVTGFRSHAIGNSVAATSNSLWLGSSTIDGADANVIAANFDINLLADQRDFPAINIYENGVGIKTPGNSAISLAVKGISIGASNNVTTGLQVEKGPVTGSIAARFIGEVNIQGNLTGSGSFTYSDVKFKTNVDSIANISSIISRLQPKSFYYDTAAYSSFNFDSQKQYGFIAQEMEAVLPELVMNSKTMPAYDTSGAIIAPALDYKVLKYDGLIAILVKGMQEQQRQLDSMKTVMSSCCSYSNSGNPHMAQQNNITQIDVELSDKDAYFLGQNMPNPFADQTTINFNVPDFKSSAEINFYNNSGDLIKSVKINSKGKGQLNVSVSELANGMYQYSLLIDGSVKATKKMVKSE